MQRWKEPGPEARPRREKAKSLVLDAEEEGRQETGTWKCRGAERKGGRCMKERQTAIRDMMKCS